MPRNASGVYTLPPTNPVVPFTTIATSWANPTMSDIATALTDSLDRNGRGGMLAPFKIYDGTVSAPGLGFLNEPNLGIFRSAAGVMNFVSGGAVVLSIGTGITTLPTTSKGAIYGESQYRLTGDNWWRAKNLAGALVFTPSATADAEDWDATKAVIFNPDGTVDFPIGALDYLPLTGGTLSGALVVNGETTINALLKVTNPVGTAAFYGYKGDAVGSGASISRFYGNGLTPTLGYKVGGGIEIVSQEAWSDTGNGSRLDLKSVKVGTATLVTAASFAADGNVINTNVRISNIIAGVPASGELYFGDTYSQYIQFDGNNWNWAGNNWKTISGNVAVGNTMQYKMAQPVTYQPGVVSGAYSADWANGLSQIFILGGNTTITPANIPIGGILRLVIGQTDAGLSFASVQWPNGVNPNFTTGPLKSALVVITNTGGYYFGTYSVF